MSLETDVVNEMMHAVNGLGQLIIIILSLL
jgi:hypothetical protein